MEQWADITSWLQTLRRSRPVFHSEADFQHALAWVIHQSDPSLRIRLETRPQSGMRLDLLVSRPDLSEHLALELKYFTAAWAGEVDSEHFQLLSQGAQDIRAYDVVKDIQRVEQLVNGQPGWAGAVLALTNDPGYWSRPGHGRVTNAQAFRIYEDEVISGTRAWGPGTGAGTRKGREASLLLRGTYRCNWTGYSALPGHLGNFRLLAITIGALMPLPGPRTAESTSGPLLQTTQHRTAEATPSALGHTSSQAPSVGAPPRRQGTALGVEHYAVEDLRAELRRFESELRAAGLKENSVATYVDRTGRFLKWLAGDYQPRGPN
jgi:hypothetical protein